MHSRPTRPTLASVLVAVAAVTLAGCGRRGDGGAAPAAGARTTVVVYTAVEPEEVAALVKAFEADHPEVRVETVRDSTGVITARLMAEGAGGAAPRADVVWGLAATSLLNADRAGLLAAYAPAGLDRIAPEFRDPRPVPHWVGTDAFMTAFAVNAAELDKANVPVPRSYADLAAPAYKGMVTMPDPSLSGTGFLTVAGLLQTMGEPGGWDYLDRLDRNVAAYTHSGSAPAELAATGEHPVGISFDFRVLQEKRKGGPLAIVFPAERSGWDLEANALVAKPTIKPAARALLDWSFGPAAFKVYAENYAILADPSYAKPLDGFPADPRGQLIKNNFAWAAENRGRILAEWNRRYAGGAR